MILVPLWFLLAAQPPTTAEGIMARVALNQDRDQDLRTAFVYHQNVMVRLNRNNGKLAREEYGEYTVTPTSKGVNKEQTLFRGKYVAHGKEVEFDKPGYEHKSIDIDADFVNQTERSHRHAPLQQRPIDLLDADTTFKNLGGLEQIREENAIDQKAG